MLKTIFDVAFSLILFYCISYCGFTYVTARRENNVPKSIVWMLLVWIGLFLFTAINK